MSTAPEGVATPTSSSRRLAGRIVVWLVFGVLFGYMLWQSIGNLVSVVTSVHAFNDFLAGSGHGSSSLARAVPWTWLVLDVLIAPVAVVVAWFASRRMTIGRTVGVFVVAFAASGALWLDLQLYVPNLLNF